MQDTGVQYNDWEVIQSLSIQPKAPSLDDEVVVAAASQILFLSLSVTMVFDEA